LVKELGITGLTLLIFYLMAGREEQDERRAKKGASCPIWALSWWHRQTWFLGGERLSLTAGGSGPEGSTLWRQKATAVGWRSSLAQSLGPVTQAESLGPLNS